MNKLLRSFSALLLSFVLLIPSLAGSALPPPEESVVYGTAVVQIGRYDAKTSSVSKPTANVKAGTYTKTQKVELSCKTNGTTIYYTTNGSAPTKSAKKYTKAFSVKKNTTVKAIAFKGSTKSAVATIKYKIRTAAPAASRKAGTYAKTISVKLTTSTAKGTIYYTTNGKNPTKNSKKYTGAIKIKKTTTIKAITIKNGMTNSKVKTLRYTIGATAATDITARPGYQSCTAQEKKAYKEIYDGITQFRSKVIIKTEINSKSLFKIYDLINYDSPELFQIKGGYMYNYIGDTIVSVTPDYRYNKTTYNTMLKKLNTKADAIVKEAKKKKNAVDQIKVIHDTIINNAYYDESLRLANSYNPYGVLVDGTGVCESYARAFQLICYKMGFPVVLTIGGNHMWNMVQVNGQWYHIDATWDDPTGARDYLEHDYFLVSTADIQKDHTIYGNVHPVYHAPDSVKLKNAA